jgi:hypothetical protein
MRADANGLRWLALSCFAMLGWAAALAQEAMLLRPTADEVMTRMLDHNRERLEALDRYSTERTYQVHYAGTGGEHKAELKVHAEYTGPDQKRFVVVSESGSKFICDKVLKKLVEGEQEATDRANRMQSALNLDNYTVAIAGEETVQPLGQGTPVKAWVLKVTPKSPSKFTYKGTVWVSEDDYAVIRIAGEPAKSPSWWIDRAHFDSRYIKRGQVWLPGRNVSSSHVRIGGEATLTIDYGSYPVVAARPLKPAVTEASLRLK